MNFFRKLLGLDTRPNMPLNPELTPPCGPIVGTSKKDIAIFKGIPYALPPEGNLRFKPPLPVPHWETPRMCTEFGDRCLQFGGILADLPNMYGIEGKSENCLSLNVWTPTLDSNKKYPVYVYIHGGGFATGSGGELMFDGCNIARRDVVVVTLNYRLGALGFLALDALKEESGTTGNYGLMDQILALHWVKENIAAFGGDPDAITIGGESAGAFSVTALLLCPFAKGLFNRAVVESGAILSIGAFARRTKGNLAKNIAMGQEFAAIFGAEDSAEGLEKLRKASPEAMTYLSMIKADQLLPMRFPFWPVYDGVMLPTDPVKALKEGNFNAVDLLIGYNTDESSLFIKNNTNIGAYDMYIHEVFGADNAPRIREAFPLTEPGNGEAELREIFTYTGFTLGMRILADAYADYNQKVWFYNFNFDAALLKIVGLDTAHSLELPFVFGNLIGKNGLTAPSILSNQMQTHWTNFMKTGDPNQGGLYKNMLSWPLYDKTNRRLMVFDRILDNRPMPHCEKLDLIEDILFGDHPYYL